MEITSRFNIIKPIGHGAMGEVFLANDKAFSDKLVAVKTIKQEYAEKKENIISFKNEYEVLSRLNHPNLIKALDFGRTKQGSYYLVMEYFAGLTLNDFVRQESSKEKIVDALLQVLRGVEFIHSRNIIYNDIKPENILVDENNQTKIIDFGLSDYESSSVDFAKGTLRYIAPEMINGKKKDRRSDIFSIGVMFYEILTRKNFFDNNNRNIFRILASRSDYQIFLNEILKPLSDSVYIEILKKMLSYNADERYSSCSEIISDNIVKLGRPYEVETEKTKEAYVKGIRFTGREKEIKIIKNYIYSDSSKIFTLMGKEGIGKSKLINEIERICTLQGNIVIQANCNNNESYGPFIEILNQILYFENFQINEIYRPYLELFLSDKASLKGDFKSKNQQSGKEQRDLLFKLIPETLMDFLHNNEKNILFVFNNSNQIDELSLDLLWEVIQRLKNSNNKKLKLLLECRSGEKKNINTFFKKLREISLLKVYEVREFTEEDVRNYVYNTFGKDFIDKSLHKAVPEIYHKYGGNPFFLKEYLKQLIADGVITKERKYWTLNNSCLSLTISNDTHKILRKRIINLKLSSKYYEGLMFLSLLKSRNITIHEIKKCPLLESPENWEKLISFLISNEIIILSNGSICFKSKIIKEVIKEDLDNEEKEKLHSFWELILRKNSTESNFEVYQTRDLSILAYHSLSAHYKNAEDFFRHSAPLLLATGIREKKIFANKKSVYWLKKLIDELKRFPLEEAGFEYKSKAFTELAEVYQNMGLWKKSESLYKKIIEIAVQTSNKTLKCLALCKLGRILMDKSNYKEASSCLAEALKISKEINDTALIALSNTNLGLFYFNKSKYNKALKCFEESRQLYFQIKDEFGACTVLGYLGVIYINKGEIDKAIDIFKKQKIKSFELGYKTLLINAIGNLGIANFQIGEFHSSEKYFTEQKKLSKEIGDKNGYSKALGNLGVVFSKTGKFAIAKRYYQEYLETCQELGNRRGIAISLGNLGNLNLSANNLEEAKEYFLKYLKVCQEIKDIRGEAFALSYLSNYYKRVKEFEKALIEINKAIDIARKIHTDLYLSDFLYSKARLLFKQQKYSESKICNEEASLLALNLNSNMNMIKTEILKNIIKAINDPEEANHCLLDLLKQKNKKDITAEIYYEIYSITNEKKYKENALKLYKEIYAQLPDYAYLERIEMLEVDN